MPDLNDGQSAGDGSQGQQTNVNGAQNTGQSTGQSQQTGTTSGAQGSQPDGQQGTQRTGAQSGFTYTEDRSKWIPPHRFNEVNTQAQRARDLESQLQQAQSRINALAGVTPSDPNSKKAEEVREAFFNLPGMGVFRKLSELSEVQIDSLLQVPSQVQQTTQAEARQWQRHGDAQVAAVSERVAEALGAEELDADQQADLRVAFSAWVRNNVKTDVEKYELRDVSESKVLQRYEAGDPKLLDEFVARYTKNWVTPGQRRSAAQTSTRTRPVPNSAGRSQVTQVRRPEKFNSLDERIEYAANRAKEMGVQFGR